MFFLFVSFRFFVLSFQRYKHKLQLYATPPIEEVSLEEFELFAVDRLKGEFYFTIDRPVPRPAPRLCPPSPKSCLTRLLPPLPWTVLKCIETAKIRWPKRGFDFDRQMTTVLKENMPLGAQNANERFDERKKDHLSHFILRLAYCKSEDLRRWFLTQECELFRFRFNQESSEGVTSFLRLNGKFEGTRIYFWLKHQSTTGGWLSLHCLAFTYDGVNGSPHQYHPPAPLIDAYRDGHTHTPFLSLSLGCTLTT